MCDRAGFFGKNPHRAKVTKNYFWTFKENHAFSFVWNLCKMKALRFVNILQKLHAWEKSGSQVIAKNSSLPMRFQYSLIVNISLID